MSDCDVPRLWIIATSVSQPVLQAYGAQLQPEWGAGFYFVASGFGTVFVSIDQLPKNRQ